MITIFLLLHFIFVLSTFVIELVAVYLLSGNFGIGV